MADELDVDVLTSQVVAVRGSKGSARTGARYLITLVVLVNLMRNEQRISSVCRE